MDHLYEMDRLKEGIGLRSYAQRDPLVEYKREGLAAFEQMLGRVAASSLRAIFTAQVRVNTFAPARDRQLVGREIKDDAGETSRARIQTSASAGQGSGGQVQPGSRQGATAGKTQPVRRADPKVSRNAPCPCGSGKKFKHCHGR